MISLNSVTQMSARGLGLGQEGEEGGGVGNDGNFLRSILQKALFSPPKYKFNYFIGIL